MVMAAQAKAATTVEITKVKDQSMIASFSNNTNLSCGTINSSLDLTWSRNLIRSDGSTFSQSVALVSFRYVNSCTGDDLTMSGFVPNANASIATDLSKGHVDAVIPVSTSPELGPVLTANLAINFNFTATGPATKFRNISQSRDGGVLTISNFSMSSRPASATGSAVGLLPLIGGGTPLNLIGSASFAAQIGKDASGSITIIRRTP
jgi:hypothetical protein